MAALASSQREYEWMAYYGQFDYFSPTTVRDGCYPRIAEHPQHSDNAVVLVHGLSDSPYYMTAIADYFFHKLGHNVYLPLLHCHGLKDPGGMEGVSLDEWKANVRFAVDCAVARAHLVAIGGLSTGGVLSFHAAVNDARVNGTLYLFSAAFDLAGRISGLGDLKERLLRTFLVDILDNNKPLIGANPYRYARVDMDGAGELSKLIEETDSLMREFSPKQPFSSRVFAAHSESDSTADIDGIDRLQTVALPDRFTFFRIPKEAGVSHASVVLKDPVYAIDASGEDEPLEKRNPLFEDMMDSLTAVAQDGSLRQ